MANSTNSDQPQNRTLQPAVRRASGAYNPGPVTGEDAPNAELAVVQAQRNDLQLEEFPEGPYGAASPSESLGKSQAWEPGQASVSAFRDANPVFSDRKLAEHEPPAQAPRGSIEGQN
ncbi:MAG: hypothetical protein K6T26_04815 [Alicyclobacillus sp.]|nr:hypothetical protein [Alicyclobacillus sp.]